MATSHEEVSQSERINNPLGCYVGRSSVRLETIASTTIWKDPAFVNFPNLLKVPAREFLQLRRFGANTYSMGGTSLIICGENFRAVLPCIQADSLTNDLKIRDHQIIEPEIFAQLLSHLGRVQTYCATSPIRFVYGVEKWVFASNGEGLYVGQLKASLPQRLILSPQVCRDAYATWSRHTASEVRISRRSVLAKNAEITAEYRCADTALPDDLYRLVRNVQPPILFAQLDAMRFRMAVQLLSQVHHPEATIQLRWGSNHCHLIGSVGAIRIEADITDHAMPCCRVAMSGLVRTTSAISNAKICVGRLNGYPGNLAFTGNSLDQMIVLPIRKISDKEPKCFLSSQQGKTIAEPRLFLSEAELADFAQRELLEQLSKVRDGDSQARAWLESEAHANPTDFAMLCNALRLDPDQIRSGVQRAVARNGNILYGARSAT